MRSQTKGLDWDVTPLIRPDDKCEVSHAPDTPVIARTQTGPGHADGMKSCGRGVLPCDWDYLVLRRTRNDNRTRTTSLAL